MTSRLDFFQTPSSITLSLLARGADAAHSSAILSTDGRTLTLTLGGASDAPRVLDVALHDAVEGAVLSVQPPRVEVALAKAPSARYAWPALVRAAGAAEAEPPRPPPPAAGAGSGAGASGAGASSAVPRRDWGAVEKALEGEAGEEAKPEGEEALMDLFRSIYAKSDENTRRAMVKSFQTSGGTVLSTNWGEVGSTDYEKKVKEDAKKADKS